MVLKSKTKKFVRSSLALFTGIGLVIGGAVTAPQAAVAAETTAVLGIKKKASAAQVKPGETLDYTIGISCSSVTALGCVGATFEDVVPAEFEVLSASVANASPKVGVIDGQKVTVAFNSDLGDDLLGLVNNSNASVTISVRLRPDVSHELNGAEISNTASVDADNAVAASSTAVVKAVVDARLHTSTSKSFVPDTAQAKPGAKTTLTIGGVNNTNGGVDTLTLTDPLDPSAQGNPFALLKFNTVDEIVWPEGATKATLEYWTGSAWSAGEEVIKPALPNAPPEDAAGVRVSFAAPGDSIAQGATAV